MNQPQFQCNQRDQLLEQLHRQLLRSRGSGERVALLVFNLRGFREINMTCGHAAGDAVLRLVAERIRSALRPCDGLFHIGNDEFAVVLTSLKSPQVVSLAAQKILLCIDRDYELPAQVVAVSAVAGGAVFPDHAGDRDALLRSADTALHLAREQEQDFLIYDASLVSREQQLANLKRSLSKALDNNDLMLHYQPQIDLQRGQVSGCEALVRWNHAEQGWIRPDVFIPVAEKSELIDTLTYWSINVALREWLDFCVECQDGAIAVNLSARLLQSTEVVDLVSRALNIWGADPGALILEVTESAMMSDPETALRVLTRLHEMGVTLSIDDFGTGYSSLAYLQKLPVSELKIDRSFVQHMADRPQDRKIVRSIIDLAHNLDMRVVAEGIEDQRSLDMLVSMGCDYGQGFYIARPMPAGQLSDWLHQAPWRKPAA
jgi:diguanylate cyclase (GGDEF)-like protein